MDPQLLFEVPEGLEATPGHMSAGLQEIRLVTDEVSTTRADTYAHHTATGQRLTLSSFAFMDATTKPTK